MKLDQLCFQAHQEHSANFPTTECRYFKTQYNDEVVVIVTISVWCHYFISKVQVQYLSKTIIIDTLDISQSISTFTQATIASARSPNVVAFRGSLLLVPLLFPLLVYQ